MPPRGKNLIDYTRLLFEWIALIEDYDLAGESIPVIIDKFMESEFKYRLNAVFYKHVAPQSNHFVEFLQAVHFTPPPKLNISPFHQGVIRTCIAKVVWNDSKNLKHVIRRMFKKTWAKYKHFLNTIVMQKMSPEISHDDILVEQIDVLSKIEPFITERFHDINKLFQLLNRVQICI